MSEFSEGQPRGINRMGSSDVFAGHTPEVKIRTKKMMMWFIIFAVVMLFSGITSALIVLHGNMYWLHINPPAVLWISNGLIVCSSITMWLAVKAVRGGFERKALVLSAITLLLGIGFVVTQNSGWQRLSDKGMGYTTTVDESGSKAYRWNVLGKLKGEYGVDFYVELRGQQLVFANGEYYLPGDKGFTDPKTADVMSTFNASGALLSVMIYIHIVHLFLGLIYLGVNLRRISVGRINRENWISLYAGGMYWHFMGILWLYLFFFIFFVY